MDKERSMYVTEKPTSRLLIGDLLVKAEIVAADKLEAALKHSKEHSMLVGQSLVVMDLVSNEDLELALEAQDMVNAGEISADICIKALKLARRHNMTFHDAVTATRAYLQEVRQQDDKSDAIFVAEQGFKVAETKYAADSRELIGPLLDLGDAYTTSEQFAKARGVYQRALGLFEHFFGPRHSKTAIALIKLAQIAVNERNFEDARTYGWRALQILQESLGPEHINTARCLRMLGSVFEAEGNLAEAEQLYTSSLRVHERVLGIENPETTAFLRQLSTFWSRKGKKGERKRVGELLTEAGLLDTSSLDHALKTQQKNSTPIGHELIQLSLITEAVLKAVLQVQILIEESLVPAPLGSKALRMVAEENHTLESALRLLGWEEPTMAMEDLKDVLTTSAELMAAERALGIHHSGVAQLNMQLADLYVRRRAFAAAEGLYKRGLFILKQSTGQKDLELADCLFRMANLYYVQKRLIESEPLYYQSLQIRSQMLGDRSALVGTTLEHLARLQEALGNLEMAHRFAEQAKQIKENYERELENRLHFFLDSPILRVLGEKQLDRLSKQVTEEIYKNGEVIVSEGDPPGDCYLVYEGSVEVVQGGKVLAYLASGEMFGEIAIARGCNRIATVRVPQSTKLLKITGEMFQDMLNKNDEFHNRVQDLIEKRLSDDKPAQPNSLQGNLAYFDLPTVLQTITVAGRDGVLSLTDNKAEEVARLAVKGHNLLNVRFKHLKGLHAFYELAARNDPYNFRFDPQDVSKEQNDPTISVMPAHGLLLEAARRADELPRLIESIGWPRTGYEKKVRVLDTSKLSDETCDLAVDVWMLLEDGVSNEAMSDSICADRYLLLRTLSELVALGFVKRDQNTSGAYRRLRESDLNGNDK
ncbi:MAG: tetratricopeptide repeat protein [Candidatus Obscuribacterales bacterium]